MFPLRQSISIETLSIWYREILLLYRKFSAIFPAELEARFRRLNMRFNSVKEKTLMARSGSDSSIEETLATGQFYRQPIPSFLSHQCLS